MEITLTEHEEDLLRRFVETYGDVAQIKKTREELKELDEALQTVENLMEKDDITNEQWIHVTDEMADVAVMLEQLKIIFHNPTAVKMRFEFKLERQLRRLTERKTP